VLAGFVAVAMYRYVVYAVVTPVTLSTVVKKSVADAVPVPS
jgi:hypothetical protein